MQLIVCSYHFTHAFQSESTFYNCLDVKELLAWNRHHISSVRDCKETQTRNQLVRKQTLNHLAKLARWLSWVFICTVHLTVCSYHVKYKFQSESTLCNSPDVKELLAWNSHNIWTLSDCNGTRTHSHLVCKRTLRDT